jgi:hypothetical protein
VEPAGEVREKGNMLKDEHDHRSTFYIERKNAKYCLKRKRGEKEKKIQ